MRIPSWLTPELVQVLAVFWCQVLGAFVAVGIGHWVRGQIDRSLW